MTATQLYPPWVHPHPHGGNPALVITLPDIAPTLAPLSPWSWDSQQNLLTINRKYSQIWRYSCIMPTRVYYNENCKRVSDIMSLRLYGNSIIVLRCKEFYSIHSWWSIGGDVIRLLCISSQNRFVYTLAVSFFSSVFFTRYTPRPHAIALLMSLSIVMCWARRRIAGHFNWFVYIYIYIYIYER